VIVAKLIAVQGPSMDIAGYYQPDEGKTNSAMRPSELFNDALAALV
jgi:isocitrate dehydrogenase